MPCLDQILKQASILDKDLKTAGEEVSTLRESLRSPIQEIFENQRTTFILVLLPPENEAVRTALVEHCVQSLSKNNLGPIPCKYWAISNPFLTSESALWRDMSLDYLKLKHLRLTFTIVKLQIHKPAGGMEGILYLSCDNDKNNERKWRACAAAVRTQKPTKVVLLCTLRMAPTSFRYHLCHGSISRFQFYHTQLATNIPFTQINGNTDMHGRDDL